MYITSQVLVFVGLIIDLIGRCLKNKKQVLEFNICASIFYISSYLFLQTWLGAIANAINFLRNLHYVFLDKKGNPYYHYLIPMTLAIVVFISCLICFWTGTLDLFLLASVIITTVGFSFKRDLLTRITILINSLLWAVYNFSVKGYVNFACDLIGLTIVIVSLIIYNIIPKIKNDKEISSIVKDNKELNN